MSEKKKGFPCDLCKKKCTTEAWLTCDKWREWVKHEKETKFMRSSAKDFANLLFKEKE